MINARQLYKIVRALRDMLAQLDDALADVEAELADHLDT